MSFLPFCGVSFWNGNVWGGVGGADGFMKRCDPEYNDMIGMFPCTPEGTVDRFITNQIMRFTKSRRLELYELGLTITKVPNSSTETQ